LELPKFNIFYHTNKGDYVEVYRKSERDFYFLTPARVDKEFYVKSDGKLAAFSSVKQKQIENDISWIIARQKTNKKLVDPESLLMKLLQFTPHIISGVISMMILWIVIRYIPDVLGSLRQLAETISQANAPTIIEGTGG